MSITELSNNRRHSFILLLLIITSASNAFICRSFHVSRDRGQLTNNFVGTVRKSADADEQAHSLVLPDYLITDSADLIDSRPTVVDLFSIPRNFLPLLLVLAGGIVAGSNLGGIYGEGYSSIQQLSIALGIGCCVLDCLDSLPPYSKDTTLGVSPNIRMGVVDDALLNAYSGIYTASSCWLALRASNFCPDWLPICDVAIAPIAILIFAFSLLWPALTLVQHYTGNAPVAQELVRRVRQVKEGEEIPQLSETELLRAKGLLGIGVVGCIFVPEAVNFLRLGQDWWERVAATYPGQPIMESSTALYGVFATQASMLAHRAGKLGVAVYTWIVPVYALLCFFLTILPCAAGLYWLGDTLSFFDFYSL